MLKNLYIQNYALIDKLDIDFQSGFSVITGETGAGKSIILGALGMVLGNRSETRSIKTGAAKCVVEATFDIEKSHLDAFFENNNLDFDGKECVVRRELFQNGKNRTFINDSPVSLAVLKSIGRNLLDIHSQHQNLLAGDYGFQLSVLDTLAKNDALCSAYGESYRAWKESEKSLIQLEKALSRERDNFDFLSFQLHEIEEEQLQADEQEELEKEQNILEHAESIKQELYYANVAFSKDESPCSVLRNVVRHLNGIVNVYPDVQEFQDRLESCSIELDDIAREISAKSEEFNFDAHRLAEVNERLDTIYRLEKKHHVADIAALLKLADEIRKKVTDVENADETLEERRKACDALRKQVMDLGLQLRSFRKKAALIVETEMKNYLQPLGMPHVQFAVELQPLEEIGENGLDKVMFRFSANKNVPLSDMAQVASGGEIARVMLSLKALLAGGQNPGTILFDEIDTGVSGRIAETMAMMMKEMSRKELQIICITHLPQIAAIGEHQYKVYKKEQEDTTTTYITALSREERITEIAHLLSGVELTDAALDNARELLNKNK